jgi:two-component system response regulator AtoC
MPTPYSAPSGSPADAADLASTGPDPELEALPAPRREERRFTLVLMVATILASAAMGWALRGEVRYALTPPTPVELGDLGHATPTADLANRYVRAGGLLASAGAIRYERPMEGDSFRLAPIAGNPGVWVEIRVPEGMEGPKFAPPTSFVGRLVPFREAGVRHAGLVKSAGAAVPPNAWLLVDGSSPRASRWAIALGVLLAYFAAYNAFGLFKLFRRVQDEPLRDVTACSSIRGGMMSNVLVVEDDRQIQRTLVGLLRDLGHDVEAASDGKAGLSRLAQGGIDLCLLDMGLPELDGMAVLQRLRDEQGLSAPPTVIVVSARDDMASTVEAVKLGAYDYLLKPLDVDRLRMTVTRALEQRSTRRALAHLVAEERAEVAEMVGRSEVIRGVWKTIGAVASTRATVLIRGESGTGKELVARAIHFASGSADAPFVAVNCTAFSRELLESELFGHVRGAFTGASSDKVGRLELARSGTLFLDEIAEIPLDLQAKLLRVLQERTYERVGDSRSQKLDARILAATHRDLAQRVKDGLFREDLYYRLEVVELVVPPLRDRKDDLPLLVERLLAKLNRELHTRVEGVQDDAMKRLTAYAWPGNVRELENVLTRACVLAKEGMLGDSHVGPLGAVAAETEAVAPSTPGAALPSLRDVERAHVVRVLAHTGWNKRRACAILAITRPTLDRKIKDFALIRPPR